MINQNVLNRETRERAVKIIQECHDNIRHCWDDTGFISNELEALREKYSEKSKDNIFKEVSKDGIYFDYILHGYPHEDSDMTYYSFRIELTIFDEKYGKSRWILAGNYSENGRNIKVEDLIGDQEWFLGDPDQKDWNKIINNIN